MSHLAVSGPKRKHLSSGQPGVSSQQGSMGTLRAAFLVILALFFIVWLTAPDQIDRAMSRVVPTGGETVSEADGAWKTVVSAITGEDGDTASATRSETIVSDTPQSGTIASGNTGQTVVTRGHDIVQMQPHTVIAVEESTPDNSSTIVRLINGSIFVEAAKRRNGETLSVETRYLVATVKGTKFDVTSTQHGAAVAVSEGLVAVRAIGSSVNVNVTPGNMAVVPPQAIPVPIVGPIPSGGDAAVIEAARGQPARKMPSVDIHGDRI